MKEPVLIVSDLHLGHDATRITQISDLRSLFEGAGTIVFNGDTWQELATVWRERSQRVLDHLKQLGDELDVEMIFLSGNHDPGWPGQGWLELADGKIVITHGDALMWAGSPWSRESFVRHDQIRELWNEHPAADHDAHERLTLARRIALTLKPPVIPNSRTLFRRVLDAVSPPRRAIEILKVWWRQSEAAAHFAAQYFPNAEVIVIGHFHSSGAWKKNGRLVINTGAFLQPHRAFWVEYHHHELRWGKVKHTTEGFFRDKQLGSTYLTLREK